MTTHDDDDVMTSLRSVSLAPLASIALTQRRNYAAGLLHLLRHLPSSLKAALRGPVFNWI